MFENGSKTQIFHYNVMTEQVCRFNRNRWAEVSAYNASSFYFGPIWHPIITDSALSTTQVMWAEVNIAQNTVKS